MSCFRYEPVNDSRYHDKIIDGVGGWDVSSQGGPRRQSLSERPSFWPSSPSRLQMDDTQTYIAEALKNMSIEDRNQVYHEVHGVDDPIEESPELLVDSFQKLMNALEVAKKDRVGDVGPFQLAEDIDPDYVHSPFYYKAFLRAERFDANRAAIRMIRFYAMKRECFGNANLCKDITQDLLSEDDLKCLARGFNQILPWRDQSGRCLFLNLPHLTKFETPEMLGRVYLYLQFKMIQDEETQKKGVACIVFDIGDHERQIVFGRPALLMAYRAMTYGLARYPVMHHCYSDDRFKMLLIPALKLFLQDIRARNKLHFGAVMECTYSLCSFGIPQHVLPFNKQGELSLKTHERFLNSLAAQERMVRDGLLKSPTATPLSVAPSGRAGNSDIVVIPTSVDVLLGRGARVNAHQGNEALHRMCEKLLAQYDLGTRTVKTLLTNGIVENVKDLGGRFIKQDTITGVWLVVDDDTARLKVSHLFRARREAVLKVATSASSGELPDHSAKRVRIS